MTLWPDQWILDHSGRGKRREGHITDVIGLSAQCMIDRLWQFPGILLATWIDFRRIRPAHLTPACLVVTLIPSACVHVLPAATFTSACI